VEIMHGDGQRILADCLARSRSAAELDAGVESAADLPRRDLQRFGAPYLHEPRLGQSTFRVAVTNAYGACAVSGEHSLPALEAAHVQPYAAGGQHSLRNGMLLRADIHRLYDKGYVTVTSSSCPAPPPTSPTPSSSTGTPERCFGGSPSPWRECHPARAGIDLREQPESR
jgi:hypothetical protein